MSNGRLTKELRKEVEGRAVRKALSARKEKLKADLIKFADELWAHEFGAIAKMAEKLPAGWVEKSSSIEVAAAGISPYSYVSKHGPNKMSRYFTMSASRPVPCSDEAKLIKVGGAHIFNDELQLLVCENLQIIQDAAELRANVGAMLGAANTRAQLLAIWPEVEELLPAEASASRALAPIGLVPQLNAAIGIPTTKKRSRK